VECGDRTGRKYQVHLCLDEFRPTSRQKFRNCSSVTLAVLSITTTECKRLSTEWSCAPKVEPTSAALVRTALRTLFQSIREATLFPDNRQRGNYVLFHERADCGDVGIRALRAEIWVG
jgi:hypothetical protein